MNPVKIAKDVYWVGAIDWGLREFHGLRTPQGTTYNAYLIVDEKITLIDSVDKRFSDEMVDGIRKIVNPAEISYIVSNHAETDHSGSIPEIIELAKNARVIATQDGSKRLEAIFRAGWDCMTVKDFEELSIGKRKLRFIHAPMLHWPETMFTYLVEEEILFTCDAFGAHLATSKRFEDEVEDPIPHAKKYYAFLVSPFSKNVQKAIEKVRGLEIKIIAPSHGPIWRRNLERLLGNYSEWTSGKCYDKAVIVFATMYGNTEKMARAISDGLTSEGIDVKLYDLNSADWSQIVMDIFDSKAVAIGTPTFVGGVYPIVESFLPFLSIPRPKGKMCVVFGSYGWAGTAAGKLATMLENRGLRVVGSPLEIQFSPDKEGRERCVKLGRELAKKIKGGAQEGH